MDDSFLNSEDSGKENAVTDNQASIFLKKIKAETDLKRDITLINNNALTSNSNKNSKKAENVISQDDLELDEPVDNNEKVFNEQINVNKIYDWSSKYKPVKPRYSNKVRVGYEWNKYNQTHYNSSNPPPKIIQGYRFNIFYPHLIDKTKTPKFTLERSDAAAMCVIRFHSGPPYEDVAFKIINREWDMTERAGYKNVFDKGILKLYFKFKRYRYKR